jgi:hypothetical protein
LPTKRWALHAWAQEALRVWEHLLLVAFPEHGPPGDVAPFFEACVAPVLGILAAGPARWKKAERLQRRQQQGAGCESAMPTPLPKAQPMTELFGQVRSALSSAACMGFWVVPDCGLCIARRRAPHAPL